MLAALLEEENYRVVTANDGATGVEMYSKHRSDLVLMDINMPVMDGYEATGHIKKISGVGNLAPIMFITSLDNEQVFFHSISETILSSYVPPFQ
jgi:CheY-like chemotaxis protein